MRSVRVKKSALVSVRAAYGSGKKEPEKVSAPNGHSQDDRPYRCRCCFQIRETPVNLKKPCWNCGRYGVTRMEEKQIRNVYIETY